MNIAMLVIGSALYALSRYQDVRRKIGVKFSLGFWIKDNWVKAAMTALCLTALYWSRDYSKDFMGVDLNNPIACLGAGLMGYGIVAAVINRTKIKG